MKPIILGYVVLVYVALTSTCMLELLGFILGKSTIGWWILDAILWIAYVSGGFGLILGYPWSRLVLLVTSATSVVSAMIGLVALLILRLEILISIGAAVPGLVIFLMALRLPSLEDRAPPEASVSVATPAHSRLLDVAYACFTWIAAVLCTIPILSLLPLDNNFGTFLAMGLGIPIATVTLLAGLVGVILSVVQWKEWPLLLMSVIIVSLLWVFLAYDEWKIVSERVLIAWGIVSTVVLVFFCTRWFMFIRRRTS